MNAAKQLRIYSPFVHFCSYSPPLLPFVFFAPFSVAGGKIPTQSILPVIYCLSLYLIFSSQNYAMDYSSETLKLHFFITGKRDACTTFAPHGIYCLSLYLVWLNLTE